MKIPMKRLLGGCLVCCVAATFASPAQAAEPLDVIKKAIKASGGKTNLLKYQAMVATGKGTVNQQGADLKYEATWIFHYPNKLRFDVNAVGMNITVIQIYDGKKGWQKIADTEAVAASDDQKFTFKTLLRVQVAATLVPLLDTKKYTIASVGEADVKGTKAVGLNITSKDGLDVNFYFDKKTHMLVKQEFQTKDDLGKNVTQTAFLSGYKKKQGVLVPTKFSVLHDGKKFVTAEFDEVTLKEKIEASVFTKP